MKKRETIRQELGITQEAMATLLNIKRSQWAMYELGQRELPTSAMLLLSEMQLYLQSPQSSVSKSEFQPKIPPREKQELLAGLLLENQYRQAKLAREIEDREKKQDSHARALQFVRYLESSPQTKTIAFPGVVKIIEIRAKMGLKRHSDTHLTLLNTQQELLLQEETWLKEALKIVEDTMVLKKR